MALTESSKVDQIEVKDTGIIQVRTVTIIERDGIEISRTNHRYTLTPGFDVSNEDPKVQAIASAIWTPEVISAYQALISNNR